MKTAITRVMTIGIFATIFYTNLLAQLGNPVVVGTDFRPKSMGNAFIAVSNDANALFYNPAGLNDVRTWQVHLVGLAPQVSYQMLETGLKISKETKGFGDKAQQDQIDQVMQWIDPLIGTYHPLAVAVTLPGFTFKHFSLRTFADPYLGFDIQNKVIPNFNAEGVVSGGVMLGFAWDFLDKAAEVGFASKAIYRIFQPMEIELAELTGKDPVTGKSNISKLTNDVTDMSKMTDRQGIGYGFDLGFKTHLTAWSNFIDVPALTETFTMLRPTIGLVWQDIFDTKFDMDVDEDEAFNPETIRKFKRIEQSLGLGFALSPQFGPLTITGALDFRELNQDLAFVNKVNTGVEFALWNLMALRLGISHLSGTTIGGVKIPFNAAGFDIDLWLLKFGVYYFEDLVGSSANARASRKVGISIHIGI